MFGVRALHGARAMSEMAPGLFVSVWIPVGKAYIMDNSEIGAPGAPPRSLAINPLDWERVEPAERERILDEITRRDAERGLKELQSMLGHSTGDER
jgi:hypothetical protein